MTKLIKLAVAVVCAVILAVPVAAQTFSVANVDDFNARIANYATATEDVVIEVSTRITLNQNPYISISAPATAGRTLTIRSANRSAPATLMRGVSAIYDLIRVGPNATLILEDIVIDGGRNNGINDVQGSLIGISNGGTLIMNDGAILRNNETMRYSGGVFVNNGGTFTMTGGEISNNTTMHTEGGGGGGNGGGVSVSGGGTFTMTGGKITGNTADLMGGGLVFSDGSVNLGGTAVISNNTKNGVANNIDLGQGKYISLGTGGNGIPLPALGMNIGVTKEDDNGVFVQSGAREGDHAYFFADESGKDVWLVRDQLVIQGAKEVTFSVATAEDFYARIVESVCMPGNVIIEVSQNLTLNQIVTLGLTPYCDLRDLTPHKPLIIRSANPAAPVILTRGVSGNLINVSGHNGNTLILENIIIDGNKYGGFGNGSLVTVDESTMLVMNDGAIVRNNGGQGVVVALWGHLTMNGGEISGNTDGVVVGAHWGNHLDIGHLSSGTFTMNGGKISNNSGSGVVTTGAMSTMGYHGSGIFTMTSGEVSNNSGGGLSFRDGSVNLGGTAIISDNTRDGVANNVNIDFSLGGKRYITLGTGTSGNGIAAPASGMRIGVTKPGDNGVFVKSGASESDLAYFFADVPGKSLIHDNGQLIILGDNADVNDFYAQIRAYAAASGNVVVEVSKNLTLDRNVTIPAPATAGRTLTIRSANKDAPVTLTRGASGNLINVFNGGTLVLEDIIIDGNKDGGFADAGGSLVTVYNAAIVMNDGAIVRNNDTKGFRESAVLVMLRGHFTMNGGEISGNNAVNGGGVLVGAADPDYMAHYNAQATFTMNGGKISNNTARNGGGVSVSGDRSTATGAGGAGVFIMTGGEISNNKAMDGAGGGVYLVSGLVTPSFTMTGGKIIGNTADFMGGGLLGRVNLGGTAVISDNTKNGVANNIQLTSISLGTGASGNNIAPPAPGMKIGVTKEGDDGVFVLSDAKEGDQAYFFADEPGKAIQLVGNQLVIVTSTSPSIVSVTDITGVPTATTWGTPLTLTGTVAPSNATNQTIVWSVADAGTTGASIDSDDELNTTAAGSVVVRATIVDGTAAGTNFTKDFTISVSKATLTGPHAASMTALIDGTTDYALSRLLPALSSGLSYGTVTYSIGVGITGDNAGKTTAVEAPAGSGTLKVTLTDAEVDKTSVISITVSSANYVDFDVDLTVTAGAAAAIAGSALQDAVDGQDGTVLGSIFDAVGSGVDDNSKVEVDSDKVDDIISGISGLGAQINSLITAATGVPNNTPVSGILSSDDGSSFTFGLPAVTDDINGILDGAALTWTVTILNFGVGHSGNVSIDPLTGVVTVTPPAHNETPMIVVFTVAVNPVVPIVMVVLPAPAPTTTVCTHTYGDWSVVTPAACLSSGTHRRICSKCGHESSGSISALGHSIGAWVTTPATCALPGHTTRRCSRPGCTHSETQNPTLALGHVLGSLETVTPATCVLQGQGRRSCSRPSCGHSEPQPIASLGHTYGSSTTVAQPTCLLPGQSRRTCTRPSCLHIDNAAIAALGHTWGPWVVTLQPTRMAEGTRVRTCQRDPSHTEAEILGAVTSISVGDQVVPGDIVDEAVIAPSRILSASLTAGPNPVCRGGNLPPAVNFYWQGRVVDDGVLVIYDALGNAVATIKITENDLRRGGNLPPAVSGSRRIIGTWDLKDNKGHQVSEGTYLVRGLVTGRDGTVERVSIIVGVR